MTLENEIALTDTWEFVYTCNPTPPTWVGIAKVGVPMSQESDQPYSWCDVTRCDTAIIDLLPPSDDTRLLMWIHEIPEFTGMCANNTHRSASTQPRTHTQAAGFMYTWCITRVPHSPSCYYIPCLSSLDMCNALCDELMFQILLGNS